MADSYDEAILGVVSTSWQTVAKTLLLAHLTKDQGNFLANSINIDLFPGDWNVGLRGDYSMCIDVAKTVMSLLKKLDVEQQASVLAKPFIIGILIEMGHAKQLNRIISKFTADQKREVLLGIQKTSPWRVTSVYAVAKLTNLSVSAP